MTVTIRMDMHCHSSASRAPVASWMRSLGGVFVVPESYSEPERVYDRARAAGMNLVTITDHDSIDGVMSLLDRGFEGVVVGEEVTVHFPEDRCRLHVLVWGLTPAQHEEIASGGLRDDVYVFADWLLTNNLAHALAHPVYSQNGKLTVPHLEKCVLLFRAWESLNGAHAGSHRFAVERYLAGLTPAGVRAMERRHGLRSLWMRAWQKAVTGGSDDHALLNIGRTWTQAVCEPGATPAHTAAEFLRRVMAGRGEVRGETGDAARLAHQVMAVTAHHAARVMGDPAARPAGAKSAAMVSRLGRLAGAEVAAPSKVSVAIDAVLRRLRGGPGPALSPMVDELARTLPGVLERHPAIAQASRDPLGPSGPAFARHPEMAAFIDDLSETLAATCARGLVGAAAHRDAGATGTALLTGVLSLIAQAPTVHALFHQNKDRDLLARLEHAHAPTGDHPHPHPPARPLRVCLFTDTLADINGVSRFIRDASASAARTGRDLEVLTSTPRPLPAQSGVTNFAPVFHAPMPGYAELDVVLPPILRMLRHADARQPDVIHVSTPGPVGLVGLLAAKMLRVPVVGVYHTDLPAYVDRLFDDAALTGLCASALRVFYSGFDRVLARSETYEHALRTLGLASGRIGRLPAGIDLACFGPSRRDPSVWSRVAAESPRHAGLARPSVKVVYVGRVSAEKNLGLLARAWKRVSERCVRAGTPADLVVVGDGPMRESLSATLAGTHAHLLGYRHADDLAALYASSHVFVFPSVTDTLGQAVMEAQASGLPAIVTDIGGPSETVDHGVTGLIVPSTGADAEDRWVDALTALIASAETRGSMAAAATERMRGRDIAASFEAFWSTHERARDEREQRRSSAEAQACFKRGLAAGASDTSPRIPENAAVDS